MPRNAPRTLAIAALATAASGIALAQPTSLPAYPATTYPATTYPAAAAPVTTSPAATYPAAAPVETRFPDTAVVLSTTPIYERVVEPTQQCRLETYPDVLASGGERQVERCYDTSRERQVVRAYSVVYRYGDRQFTTELPYDPGPRLRVDVAINPSP